MPAKPVKTLAVGIVGSNGAIARTSGEVAVTSRRLAVGTYELEFNPVQKTVPFVTVGLAPDNVNNNGWAFVQLVNQNVAQIFMMESVHRNAQDMGFWFVVYEGH